MTQPNYQAMHTAHISLTLQVIAELKITSPHVIVVDKTPRTHEQAPADITLDDTLSLASSAPAMILPPAPFHPNTPAKKIDHSEQVYRDLILVLLERLETAAERGDVSEAALLNWQLQMMQGKVKPVWWGVVVRPRAVAAWDSLESLVD